MDKTRFQTDAGMAESPDRQGRMTNLSAASSGKTQGTRFLSPGAPVSSPGDRPRRRKGRKSR